jgi:hypothetical protein
MAYPTIDAPYGLKPVNLIGGLPFAGATRQFKIASGYPANLFNGDLVKLVAAGTVEKDAGTATATPVGVFLGCSYTDPVLKYKLFSQYWPTGTVAADAVAYVCDDPNALFKVAAVSGTTVIASYGRTLIGSNVELVQNAGSTATGNSAVAILGTSSNTTNTLPIRIIDVVPDTATGADAFVEFIVKINAGMHQYNNATGV